MFLVGSRGFNLRFSAGALWLGLDFIFSFYCSLILSFCGECLVFTVRGGQRVVRTL